MTVLRDEFLGSLEDARMDQFIQRRQLFWIGKGTLRHPASVDLAGRRQNLPSKQPGNFIPDRLFVQQLVSDGIGADHCATQLSELCRNGALAGGDAANDADNWLFPGIAHIQAVRLLANSHFAALLYRPL